MFDLTQHQFRNGYYETVQRNAAIAKSQGNTYSLVRPFEKEEVDFLAEQMLYAEAVLVNSYKRSQRMIRRRRRSKK